MTQTQQPEALRIADLLEQCSLNSLLSPFMEVANELRRQHARIADLESQLSATNPIQQGLDAQTIRHISALSELVRMPNAEHFADAHNAAVRHLRVIAAQAKQGGA